jgi:hypothetical protein
MPVLLFIALFLSGCTSQAEAVESQLNSYALASSRGANLDSWLTGNALESSIKSSVLVQDLGLTSYGSSRFSQTRQIAKDRFESCLDVSGTQFRDSSGEVLDVARLERQIVEVSRQEDLVSEILLSGAPC